MMPMQLCRTKIVATAGPATDGLERRLIEAGVSVFRVNFSHGEASEHRQRVTAIRTAAIDAKHHVAVLGDLQGPKIRIGQFTNGAIELAVGAAFTIDAAVAEKEGSDTQVGTTYQHLGADCQAGDVLVIGDGLIELAVTGVSDGRVDCRVITGGTLSGGKGINKRGGGLSAAALTPKDEADIKLAAQLDVDYLAVSFPRSGADIEHARQLANTAKLRCHIVAKIERAETVATDASLDELISAADAVMIARGDLGIEIGYPALMGVQKRITQRARALNRPVITATQMMESMIENPSPTRAEVLDVANAVLDGTDAIMLSGETAVGAHPVKVIEAVVSVMQGAEATAAKTHLERRNQPLEAIDHAIALGVMSVARRLERVTAIVCFTSSGNTPRLMSRYLGPIPIYAMLEEPKTLAWVALYRGVQPVFLNPQVRDYEAMNQAAIQWLEAQQAVASGDRVIISKGDLRDVRESGGTNTLKVIEIG